MHVVTFGVGVCVLACVCTRMRARVISGLCACTCVGLQCKYAFRFLRAKHDDS